MKKNNFTHFWGLLIYLLFAVSATYPSSVDATPPNDYIYIALGDSIENGYGLASPEQDGYVPRFRDFLAGYFKNGVDLDNLSVTGATVREIAIGQLPEAITDIKDYKPNVVISWGGGGDDLLNFVMTPEAAKSCLPVNAPRPSCIARIKLLLKKIEETVDFTIHMLRIVAGPGTEILMRGQYNPFNKSICPPPLDNPLLHFSLADLADAVIEGRNGYFIDENHGLNDRLHAIADSYDAKIVEIYDAIYTNSNDYIAEDCAHLTVEGQDAIFNAAIDAF